MNNGYAAVMEAVASRVPTDGNTWLGEDGLRYCNICDTARQCRIEIPGRGERVVNCLCKCMVARREAEREEQRQRELAIKIAKNRSLGFSDEVMRRSTFEVDDGAKPEITRAAKAFVDNYDLMRREGKGLLLYGPVGTGKSFYAACIVNAIIDTGKPALMTNFSRLVNEIAGAKWENKQEVIDNLARYALVAIDDLGVERDSDFVGEHVTVVVDTLYRAKTPIIITSNFGPKQLRDEGSLHRRRIYDRLLERCHPVAVLGESRRRQKGATDYDWMKDILGV